MSHAWELCPAKAEHDPLAGTTNFDNLRNVNEATRGSCAPAKAEHDPAGGHH